MSLLLLFQYSEETLAYFNFKVLQPDRKNKVLGLMQPQGTIYCRVDMERYHISQENIKYITYKHTLNHDYECIKCGERIAKENMDNRYFKVHKVGKSRRWSC